MMGSMKGTVEQTKDGAKWIIHRFLTDCQGVGDYCKSPLFSVRYGKKITKWYLKVYPKGDTEQNKDHVSLYLYCSDSGNEIEISGEYQLRRMSRLSCLPASTVFTGKFKKLTESLGCARFGNYLASAFTNAMIADTLIISCEILLDPPSQDDTENFPDEWLNKTANDLFNYEKLLENGNFSDVTLTVQDKKIKSHKAILSCHSPVFQAIFEHDMKEKKESIVVITDIGYDVIMGLLQFIYSGKVKDIERIASDLLIAADRYQITQLKALCEKTLYRNITVYNAAEYLKLTEMCHTIYLQAHVVEFIAAHYKDVERMPGFADLSNKMMHQIILAIANQK